MSLATFCCLALWKRKERAHQLVDLLDEDRAAEAGKLIEELSEAEDTDLRARLESAIQRDDAAVLERAHERFGPGVGQVAPGLRNALYALSGERHDE